LCAAHIARELIAADETHSAQHWPQQAVDVLFALNTPPIPPASSDNPRFHRTPPIHWFMPGGTPSWSAWPNIPAGRAANSPKTRNVLERLRDREDVLRFAHDLTVPFTNNQAERDLRPTKTQTKISGTFPSETSARAGARTRGYVYTALKHDITAFDAHHRKPPGHHHYQQPE
jgi:hypothetical protein